jgi:hypothetical protein
MTETWHGKNYGYRIRMCRCDACKKAHSEAQGAFRARKYARRVLSFGRLVHPDAPHGTENGYRNYGCRCSECTRAVSRGAA